jgi:hypothetical protein
MELPPTLPYFMTSYAVAFIALGLIGKWYLWPAVSCRDPKAALSGAGTSAGAGDGGHGPCARSRVAVSGAKARRGPLDQRGTQGAGAGG